MIINSSTYTSFAAQHYRSAPPQITSESQDSRDNTAAENVNISQAGKTAQIALADLPPLILDPKVHMQNAEIRLKEIMTEMGIPASTDIDINVSNSGHISVKGNNEQLAKLEEMLNSGEEMDLRNSLIGTHTGNIIQRIGAAASMAAEGAEAQPSMADHYFNWVLDIANQAKASSFAVSLTDGKLSGNLLGADGGKMIAVQDFKLSA